MRRREFVTLVGGMTASALPRAALAQQPALPVIGYLSARSEEDTRHLVDAFRKGLGESGFVEGRNVAIEYRWGNGQYERLPGLAAELARRPLSVIASTGGEPAALAMKAATSTIPVVFAIGGDPVKQGLVASFNRPGGNTTGITLLTNTLEPKRLGLLRELMPQAAAIGFLFNPNFLVADTQLKDVEVAAAAVGLKVHVLRANTEQEIESAFQTAATERVAAIAVAASPFFDTRREKLVELAARHKVPTMFHFREFAVAGGLMSYGIDPADAYRQVGVYTGRVLKGEKPANLPVLQATKFEFVINQKTAKTLGVRFSDNLISLADEVIE